jgi:uncharacterized protein YkwD
MKKSMISLLLPVLLIFGSCAKDNIEDSSPVVETPVNSNVPTTVNRSIMLQLVNQVRQAGCNCGGTYYAPVPSVTWSNQLETAAYNHSSDMFKNNYFSHTSLDGSNTGTRIERTGYKWMAYGENIAKGYKTEKEVLDGWLSSPGHCRTIMSSVYKEIGVAKVGDYWTQDFATKLN